MIVSVANAYSTQAVNPLQNQSEQTNTQQREQTGDTVSFSKEAKVASFLSGHGIDSLPDKTITLDDIKNELSRSSAQLTDNVNQLFLSNDISLDPPVELTTDGEGNVRVKGDHPDKEKIEQLFADNPELSNDFRGVSAMSSFSKAAEEYLEFAKEYDKDPYAAVTKFGHMFDGLKDEPFSMLFGAKEKA